MTLPEALAEIERLRARIAELEAAHAVTLGTLEALPESTPQPFSIEHNVPGNAPV
jgi:hypothetical protein